MVAEVQHHHVLTVLQVAREALAGGVLLAL